MVRRRKQVKLVKVVEYGPVTENQSKYNGFALLFVLHRSRPLKKCQLLTELGKLANEILDTKSRDPNDKIILLKIDVLCKAICYELEQDPLIKQIAETYEPQYEIESKEEFMNKNWYKYKLAQAKSYYRKTKTL